MRLIHNAQDVSDEELLASLNKSEIRQYEVMLLDEGLSSRTVSLHLSALSGFCRYLVGNDCLNSNPVKLVAKPKAEKRLPVYFKKEAMDRYFEKTSAGLSPGSDGGCRAPSPALAPGALAQRRWVPSSLALSPAEFELL